MHSNTSFAECSWEVSKVERSKERKRDHGGILAVLELSLIPVVTLTLVLTLTLALILALTLALILTLTLALILTSP